MPEGISAENLLNNIMETLHDNAPIARKKSVTFFEEEKRDSVSSQFNSFFVRQKPVHHLLGGGKSADVLLWRNKKISASVLIGATAVWILFEWLNYHLLSLIFLGLVIGMIGQFLWSNASGIISRSSSEVPRIVLPDELFVNIAITIGGEINCGLRYLQDVACGGNLKQFLAVVASLWAAAIIGSWCNFLTVLYIGFVGAHTLPVLYERYDDKVDGFVYNMFGQVQHHYRKLDKGLLSRIPSRNFRYRKYD
jgi:hypothetical protein